MILKRMTAFVCAFAIAGACAAALPTGIPKAAAAGSITETEGAASSNAVIDTDNHIYDNQDKTVKSYLYQSGENTITRVEYITDKVIVENYDMSTGKLLNSRELNMELPIFGGFYAGKDYNFLVTGQKNTEENNDKAVFAVTRFTKDFKSSRTKILNGRNTIVPFAAGSCRMTETQGMLYIHTCHQMYTTSDGLNHQANMSFVLDIENMKFTQENYSIGYHNYKGVIGDAFGYTSHSFDQFIVSDDTAVYVYDHGDYYPRALRVHKYTLSDGYLSYSDVVNIPETDSNTHYNYTGVLTGDMELSEDNVIIGAKLADLSVSELSYSTDIKDICIIVMPKSEIGSGTEARVINLTNYKTSGTTYTYNSAPKLVKINDNKFLVIWKESSGYTYDYDWDKGEWLKIDKGSTTRYAFIDANGSLIGSITENPELILSDCDPILCSDGMVRWYAANGSSPVIYSLDPSDPANFSSSGLPGDVNEDGKVNIKDVMLIQQHIVGWNVTLNTKYADVNADGKINIKDVMLIQQYIVGWKVELK